MRIVQSSRNICTQDVKGKACKHSRKKNTLRSPKKINRISKNIRLPSNNDNTKILDNEMQEAANDNCHEDMEICTELRNDEWTQLSFLPPIHPKHRGKKTLVLDLDETLVHSSFEIVTGYHFALNIDIDNEIQSVYVFKRPGVEHFMKAMAEIFEIVVFTASLQGYADPVIDELDIHCTVAHRLYRESCIDHLGGFVKDLSCLGREMRNIIIVDNNPHSFLLQPENAIHIGNFYDDPQDHALIDLMPMLDALAGLDDVTVALAKP